MKSKVKNQCKHKTYLIHENFKDVYEKCIKNLYERSKESTKEDENEKKERNIMSLEDKCFNLEPLEEQMLNYLKTTYFEHGVDETKGGLMIGIFVCVFLIGLSYGMGDPIASILSPLPLFATASYSLFVTDRKYRLFHWLLYFIIFLTYMVGVSLTNPIGTGSLCNLEVSDKLFNTTKFSSNATCMDFSTALECREIVRKNWGTDGLEWNYNFDAKVTIVDGLYQINCASNNCKKFAQIMTGKPPLIVQDDCTDFTQWGCREQVRNMYGGGWTQECFTSTIKIVKGRYITIRSTEYYAWAAVTKNAALVTAQILKLIMLGHKKKVLSSFKAVPTTVAIVQFISSNYINPMLDFGLYLILLDSITTIEMVRRLIFETRRKEIESAYKHKGRDCLRKFVSDAVKHKGMIKCNFRYYPRAHIEARPSKTSSKTAMLKIYFSGFTMDHENSVMVWYLALLNLEGLIFYDSILQVQQHIVRKWKQNHSNKQTMLGPIEVAKS